jgi:PAS domain-containing protein
MDDKAQVRAAPHPTIATSRQLLADIPFQELLDAAPDAIVIVDASGRIVVVNAQVERFFGYGRAKLIGQPVELPFQPDR